MCGLGLKGKWFAAEHYGATPGILLMGKELSGGAIALSAIALREEHVETVSRTVGSFAYGGTFSHNVVACVAEFAAVRLLEREAAHKKKARTARHLANRKG